MKKTKGEKPIKNTNLLRRTKVYALIYYSNHKTPDKVKINNISEQFFTYKGRAYYIDFENVMTFKIRGFFIFSDIYYLFYYYSSESPLSLSEELSNITQKRISNEIINIALKTKAIERANDITNNNLLSNEMLLYGGIAVLVAIGFYMFGGV